VRSKVITILYVPAGALNGFSGVHAVPPPDEVSLGRESSKDSVNCFLSRRWRGNPYCFF